MNWEQPSGHSNNDINKKTQRERGKNIRESTVNDTERGYKEKGHRPLLRAPEPRQSEMAGHRARESVHYIDGVKKRKTKTETKWGISRKSGGKK